MESTSIRNCSRSFGMFTRFFIAPYCLWCCVFFFSFDFSIFRVRVFAFWLRLISSSYELHYCFSALNEWLSVFVTFDCYYPSVYIFVFFSTFLHFRFHSFLQWLVELSSFHCYFYRISFVQIPFVCSHFCAHCATHNFIEILNNSLKCFFFAECGNDEGVIQKFTDSNKGDTDRQRIIGESSTFRTISLDQLLCIWNHQITLRLCVDL